MSTREPPQPSREPEMFSQRKPPRAAPNIFATSGCLAAHRRRTGRTRRQQQSIHGCQSGGRRTGTALTVDPHLLPPIKRQKKKSDTTAACLYG